MRVIAWSIAAGLVAALVRIATGSETAALVAFTLLLGFAIGWERTRRIPRALMISLVSGVVGTTIGVVLKAFWPY